MMFAQLCESSKSTELYTLKEWVFKLYVNEAVFFLITWVALWGMGCAMVSMDKEEKRMTWIRLVALKWRELDEG